MPPPSFGTRVSLVHLESLVLLLFYRLGTAQSLHPEAPASSSTPRIERIQNSGNPESWAIHNLSLSAILLLPRGYESDLIDILPHGLYPRYVPPMRLPCNAVPALGPSSHLHKASPEGKTYRSAASRTWFLPISATSYEWSTSPE